jgi:hypothetical protein
LFFSDSYAGKISLVPEGMPAKVLMSSGLNQNTLMDILSAKTLSNFKGKWKIIVGIPESGADVPSTAAISAALGLGPVCRSDIEIIQVSTPGDEVKYIQDFFQTGKLEFSKKSAILLLPHSYPSTAEKVVLKISERVPNTEILKTRPGSTFSGNFGGNLDSFGPDFVLLGSSATSGFRSEIDSLISGVSNIAPATDWLQVGHLDEWISLAASNPSNLCPSVITVADPKLGSDLLESSIQGNPASPYDSSYDIDLVTKGDKCQKYTNYAFWTAMGKVRGFDPNPVAANVTAKAVFDRIKSTVCDGALGTTTNICGAGLKMIHKCFKDLNEAIKLKIDQELQLVLGAVPAQCGSGTVKIVRVPQFYVSQGSGNALLDEFVRKVRSMDSLDLRESLSLIALWPNSTNSVVLSEGNLLVPKAGIASVESEITNRYQDVGIKVHFIETRHYHARGGNIHCITNSFR